MESLKILIVEDDLINATDVRETLEEAGHTITAIARTFDQALKAVRQNPPDLALVDIDLKDSTANGIETARQLTDLHRMPIIYLTANTKPRLFQSAKETLPAAYLLKPFRRDELKLHVELAYHHYEATSADPSALSGSLYLPVDGGLEKIDTADVLYVKAAGSYALVFLADERKYDKSQYIVSMNLSNLAQYFTTPNFYRLSRSYLVNLDYVKRLKDDNLYLANHPTVLQIPATSRKELMKKLTVVRTK